MCVIARAVWQKGSDLNISNTTFRSSFLSAFFFFGAYYIRFKSQPSRRFADKLICGEQVMMICDKSSNDAKCGFCRRRSSDSLSVTPVLALTTTFFFFFATLAMPRDADCFIVLLIPRPFYSAPLQLPLIAFKMRPFAVIFSQD